MKEDIYNKILKRRGFSWTTPKSIVKKSPKRGKGIFAKEKIPKDEVVNVSGGIVVNEKEYYKLKEQIGEFLFHYTTKIEEGLYLLCAISEKELENDDYFNHSCNPNCGVRGQIVLVTMREIEPGEELTYDYAMTDDDEDDRFECNCGSNQCRGIVTGEDWKIPKLQKKYKGYFSQHIQNKINTDLQK